MSVKSRGLGLSSMGLNVGRTLMAEVVVIAMGLGMAVLLARGLGPKANGMYALALLLPTMLATFLNLGIGPSNVYHVGRKDLTAREALRASVWVWVALAGIGLVASPIVLSIWGDQWFPGVPGSLMVLALISFPMTLLQSYIATLLQGVQDFRRYNGLMIVTPFVTLVLSALLILVFDTGVVGAVSAYVVGQGLSLLLAWYVLRPHVARGEDARHTPADTRSYVRTSIKYGWKAHLGNILAFVNYRVDIFLVNLYLTPALAGIYWVSIQIAERMWILSKVVSVVMLPRLSELHTEEEKRLALTPLVSRLVLAVTILGSLLLALVSKPAIDILFGAEFSPARNALLLLLPGVVAGSSARVVANDISARGRPEVNSMISGAVMVINVAANVVLIPRYGINGGAIATSIAYGVNALIKFIVYSKMTGRSPFELVILTRDDLSLVRDGWQLVKERRARRRSQE
jgi:O-antigen/teichoic acid export membrane protein